MTSNIRVMRSLLIIAVFISTGLASTAPVAAHGIKHRDRNDVCATTGNPSLLAQSIYHEYQTTRGGAWYVASVPSRQATSKNVQPMWGPDTTWNYATNAVSGFKQAGHYGVTYTWKGSRALTAPQYLSCTTY